MPNLELCKRKRKVLKKKMSQKVPFNFHKLMLYLYFTYETGSIFNSPSNKGGKYK